MDMEFINMIKYMQNKGVNDPFTRMLNSTVEHAMEVDRKEGGLMLTLAKKIEEEKNALYEQGGCKMIYSLVQDGDLSIEKGSKKLDISTEDLIRDMKENGYTIPD